VRLRYPKMNIFAIIIHTILTTVLCYHVHCDTVDPKDYYAQLKVYSTIAEVSKILFYRQWVKQY